MKTFILRNPLRNDPRLIDRSIFLKDELYCCLAAVSKIFYLFYFVLFYYPTIWRSGVPLPDGGRHSEFRIWSAVTLSWRSKRMENKNWDFYYGDESNQFLFYRIPQQLIVGKDFKRLSVEAKLLYGLRRKYKKI